MYTSMISATNGCQTVTPHLTLGTKPFVRQLGTDGLKPEERVWTTQNEKVNVAWARSLCQVNSVCGVVRNMDNMKRAKHHKACPWSDGTSYKLKIILPLPQHCMCFQMSDWRCHILEHKTQWFKEQLQIDSCCWRLGVCSGTLRNLLPFCLIIYYLVLLMGVFSEHKTCLHCRKPRFFCNQATKYLFDWLHRPSDHAWNVRSRENYNQFVCFLRYKNISPSFCSFLLLKISVLRVLFGNACRCISTAYSLLMLWEIFTDLLIVTASNEKETLPLISSSLSIDQNPNKFRHDLSYYILVPAVPLPLVSMLASPQSLAAWIPFVLRKRLCKSAEARFRPLLCLFTYIFF
jgi:hypothetical protein